MASQALKFKIGLFVVASLSLTLGGIIWLGAARFFEDAQTVVAYFSESVQGLQIDSSVKFRGVAVGRVTAIKMAPDGKLIEVVMSLNKKFKTTDDLGVKIDLLGLTGMKYLEMDRFRPDQRKEPIQLDFTPRYPVIATYPSDIKEFGNALEFVFQKLKSLEVERLSGHLVRVLANLDKILADPKLQGLSSDASETLREVKETVRRVGEEVTRAQPARHFTRTMDKATQFFEEGTELTRSGNQMIRRADNNINRLTQKLERSADNLIDFTRMIKVKPSSILFGPGEKSERK